MFRKYTKIIEHFSFFGTKSCINNKKWPNAEKHLTIVYSNYSNDIAVGTK